MKKDFARDRLFFESLANSIEEGIVLLDLNREIIYINGNAEEMLCTNMADICSLSFDEVFSGETALSAFIDKVLADSRSFSVRQEQLRLCPGRGFDLFLSPFFIDARVQGVVVSLRESPEPGITDNGDFDSLMLLLSTVAHEIKNPLTGIKASAQLLRPTASESQIEFVDRIIGESRRLNKVLQDYLITSKRPVLHDVNIHEVLEVALKLLDTRIRDKSVRIHRHYDPSVPPVKGDEDKLLRVFLNIMGNAVDALAPGGAIVLTSRPSSQYVRRQGHCMRWAVVDVEDNGCGISKKDLERVFMPFFTGKKDGVGLGLAISKKIMADHRGMIKVNSREGKGSVFSVYIPLSQAGPDETGPDKAPDEDQNKV